MTVVNNRQLTTALPPERYGTVGEMQRISASDELDRLARFDKSMVRTFLREENRRGSYPSVRVLINNNSTGWIGYGSYCTESP